MRSTTLGLSLLSLLPFAAAHGYLRSITIDGQQFEGNIPNGAEADSPIRLIDSIEPVKGATNAAMTCGPNAKQAALVADANPGSTLEFAWAGGDNGNWPHNTGPMITYLASCGETTCDQFDAAGAQWFKVDEAGKEDGSSTWLQQNLMNGQSYSMTLPNNLAAGQYLVRHEVIGLHIASEQGGAEFYPSCSQINVGGSETGTPSSSDLVAFPGGYTDTDPGILVNAFSADAYDFPGPEIAELSGGGSGGTISDTGSGSSPSSTSARSTRTSSGASPPGTATRAAAVTTTSVSDSPSATTSTAQSSSSSTRRQRNCDGGSASTSSATVEEATATAAATATQSAVSSGSGEESTISSFAVTSTISLDAVPSSAVTVDSVPSEAVNAADVRPRRVSRVMRNLYAHM